MLFLLEVIVLCHAAGDERQPRRPGTSADAVPASVAENHRRLMADLNAPACYELHNGLLRLRPVGNQVSLLLSCRATGARSGFGHAQTDARP